MSAAVRANAMTGSDWLKNSFSIWRGLGRDTDAKEHPATFPVALASKIIDCFSANPDGILLDPFAGSGSSMVAAIRAGMGAVGFDINPEYRGIFESRLTSLDRDLKWEYQIADARTLSNVVDSESVEICITSPPYWDILNRRRTADKKEARAYSVNGSDLGNIPDYEKFLDGLTCVATQVGWAMRKRGYFVMNVMDIRKGPSFYPLHQDVSQAIVGTELFSLEDIIIWDRQADYNSMRPLGYPYKFIVNKVHEYLLVFRKRD